MPRFPWASFAAALALAPLALPALADTNLALTITNKGCEPGKLSTSAGASTFEITNASTRVLEWEILSGAMVVAERENILPGFKATVTAKLDAGEYVLTCGLLSNPNGLLLVEASGTAAKAGTVDPMELVGPIAEYKVYVQSEADAFVTSTKAFTAAVKSGDVPGAQALYAEARSHYERIEPIAELFSDIDGSIDSRADDWEKREADPGFTGYHRLEYALYKDPKGTDMNAMADGLQANVEKLQGQIKSLTIPPASMIGGAAVLIEGVAGTKISGEEDRYSGTDLTDFQANIDGAKKVLDLIGPLVGKRDADLLARTNGNFGTVDGVLAKYRNADGSFQSYSALTDPDRKALQGPVEALAEDLAKLAGVLGIQES